MSDDKLDLILNELRSVKSDINSMKTEMSSMKSDINSMQTRMGSMESEMNSMQTRMGSMESEMNSMKAEMGSIKSDINIIKSQLDENTQLTKAIYHRQEEFEPKFQGDIKALNEKVGQIAAGQRAISRMLGEHEIAIRTIRNPI